MPDSKKRNIYETINAVMDEIGAIGKNSKNPQQGFMYRGVDAVMNTLNPALVKYKLFVVPEILEQIREERQTSRGGNLIYSICKIKYTFYAEDGSSVSAVVIGEGMDSGDKATNKAMSVAFKYACFQVFCIPTEEMVDPDAEVHEVVSKQAVQSKPAPAPKATPLPHDAPTTSAEGPTVASIRAELKQFCVNHKINPNRIVADCGLNANSVYHDYVKAIEYAKRVLEEEGELPFQV